MCNGPKFPLMLYSFTGVLSQLEGSLFVLLFLSPGADFSISIFPSSNVKTAAKSCLPVCAGAADTTAYHIRANSNNTESEVRFSNPHSQALNVTFAQRPFFYELQEFNVYFTDTEESFCFIYLLRIAASQCHGTSFSERLKMFRIFQNLFFFSSSKNISMCFDIVSDELNMQTSRLPRKLMGLYNIWLF